MTYNYSDLIKDAAILGYDTADIASGEITKKDIESSWLYILDYSQEFPEDYDPEAMVWF
ncbi:MAG: hypothetical protein ACRC2R_09180 [Xenococcaceae cyanobacterium]